MSYQILLSKQVQKFLKTQEKKVILQVQEILEKLAKNPYDKGLDIQALSEVPQGYRLRIRNMRFLYTFLDNKIVILVFKGGYRGDIYK